jgi:hypothetical protein
LVPAFAQPLVEPVLFCTVMGTSLEVSVPFPSGHVALIVYEPAVRLTSVACQYVLLGVAVTSSQEVESFPRYAATVTPISDEHVPATGTLARAFSPAFCTVAVKGALFVGEVMLIMPIPVLLESDDSRLERSPHSAESSFAFRACNGREERPGNRARSRRRPLG